MEYNSERKRKIILNIFIQLGIIFVIYFFAVLIAFIEHITKEHFSNKTLLYPLQSKYLIILMAIAYVSFNIYVFYLRFKANSTNITNKIHKSKNTMHGYMDFMTPQEMADNYGLKLGEKKVKRFNPKTQKMEKEIVPFGRDIKFSELRNVDFNGILLNTYKKNGELYIERAERRHMAMLGMSGAGKSTRFITPMIQLNAQSNPKTRFSFLCFDLKGELWNQNAKMLKEEGYKCLRFDFRTPKKSNHFNPMDSIWDNYHTTEKNSIIIKDYFSNFENLSEIEKEAVMKTPEFKKMAELDVTNDIMKNKLSSDIFALAKSIIPEVKAEDKFWADQARSVIQAIIYALLEDSLIPEYGLKKENFRIKAIIDCLTTEKPQLQSWLKNRNKISPVHAYASSIVDQESEKTTSSIISYAQGGLIPFGEAGIVDIQSYSDVNLDEIVNEPTAIFFIIPDENSQRDKIAIAMMEQIYNHLTYLASLKPNNTLDRSFYFLLDEFASMPKLSDFTKYIATSRGRNIFFAIMLQSISQLDQVYGVQDRKTILQNCHIQMYLKANEKENFDYFINLVGSQTIDTKSQTFNERNASGLVYEGTSSIGERKVLTQSDLQLMKDGEIYFIESGKMVCHSHIVPFYDKELQKKKIFRTEVDDEIIYTPPKKKDLLYQLANRNQVFKEKIKPLMVDGKYIPNPFSLKEEASETSSSGETSSSNGTTINKNNEDIYDIVEETSKFKNNKPTNEVEELIINEDGEVISDVPKDFDKKTQPSNEEKLKDGYIKVDDDYEDYDDYEPSQMTIERDTDISDINSEKNAKYIQELYDENIFVEVNDDVTEEEVPSSTSEFIENKHTKTKPSKQNSSQDEESITNNTIEEDDDFFFPENL